MDAVINKNAAPHHDHAATLQPSNDDSDNLLCVLKRVMPSVSDYKSLDTVTQSNAEGSRIRVDHNKGTSDTNGELFVKRIQAIKYKHKSWADFRRTLLYARTEVRFYNETLPKLSFDKSLAPHCFHAEYNLQGLVDDEEHVTDESPIAGIDGIDLQNIGGTIVLEPLDSNSYYQDSPLSPSEALKCLEAAAKLHAAAWQDKHVLQHAQQRLSKPSFHLAIRNPKELEGMVESWSTFTNNFASLAPELFEKPGIQNLGQRVYDMAHYVSKETTPSPTDEYATLVHGDYKAMNLFLPKNSEGSDAVMIDFASVGVGLGMSDVAMHLVHALEPHHLKDGQEEELVYLYLEYLNKARTAQTGKDGSIPPYPRHVAMRHYRLASIDYFRFILGRFWKSATPESFEKKKKSRNTTLVNRNLESALAFIEKIDGYLQEFEVEKESRKKE